MAKRGKSIQKGKTRTTAVVQVRGSRVPDFGDDLVVIRTGRFAGGKRSAKRADEAQYLVKKLGTLKQTGLRRDVVFGRNGSGVFAYSVDPNNPSRILRRSSAGKTTAGRFVAGRFKAN